MKKTILLLFILLSANIFANTEKNTTPTITADVALNTILNNSIQVIIDAKTSNPNISHNEMKQIINTHFLPFIDTSFSAKNTLPTYWEDLTPSQKINLEQYIVNSLINDYSGVLSSFNNFENIEIIVDPNIKTRDNKAIVTLEFRIDEQNKPLLMAAKMVKHQHWKIYDVVFSGVSLVKNYAAQFNSYIKRKGFEAFVDKYLNKT
jgi:phospholipid transport system substrate-binding protein